VTKRRAEERDDAAFNAACTIELLTYIVDV